LRLEFNASPGYFTQFHAADVEMSGSQKCNLAGKVFICHHFCYPRVIIVYCRLQTVPQYANKLSFARRKMLLGAKDLSFKRLAFRKKVGSPRQWNPLSAMHRHLLKHHDILLDSKKSPVLNK
jgi:hypothetical protein